MNEHDLQGRQIARSVRGALDGSRNSGANVAGVAGSVPPPSSSTSVDSDGKVRRLWLIGDPWSDDFYFGEDDPATVRAALGLD